MLVAARLELGFESRPRRSMLNEMKARFDIVPVVDMNEIAFCGLACGKCIKGKGETKECAMQILKDIQESGVDHWHHHEPKQFDYDDLKEGLMWLASFDCKGCHAGGGNPGCAIRKCAKEMGVDNCGECLKMPCNVVRAVKEQTGIAVEKNFNH